MKPQNPEAFPTSAFDPSTGHLAGQSGMTLRDYFAAKAMQGWLAGSVNLEILPPGQNIAAFAYDMADAMLVERERDEQDEQI